MSRKLSWILRVIINLIRCPLKTIFSFGHIKYEGFQKIALNTNFETTRDGFITVGNRVTIDSGTLCRASHGNMKIGNHVYINRNCNIVCHKSITIGNKCTIGPNVCIYDHDHDFRSDKRNTKYISKDIYIGENVWIGANVVILKGCKIGNNAVIGAGAIVKHDVPENTIYVSVNEYKIIPIIN